MSEMFSIIIINWNNKNYLERCIDSVIAQSYKNIEIIFIDNNSNDGSLDYINIKYPDLNFTKIRNEKNLGYSVAANLGIRLSKGEFVVILNPDVILEKYFLEESYNLITKDQSIGAVTGKLLKYDFSKDYKLNIIDSTGIIIGRNRQAVDRGQGQLDKGQYGNTERVFGVSGAAPIYRKSSLEDVKVFNEYFDEDFFAYKEDVDLSWRLNLCGYKCIFCPKIIAYHGRTMSSSNGGFLNYKNIKNRKSQSEFLRGISFRNHYLMLIKNENRFSYNKDKLKIWMRIFLFLCYSALYERFNFSYLKQILVLKPTMLAKRKEIEKKIKVSDEMIYYLFDN